MKFAFSLPRSKRSRLLLMTLLLAVIVGAIATYVAMGRKSDSKAPDRRQVVTYSTDTPSEEKPGETYQWRGLATDPKKIIMPTIGVDGFVQNVGVDQKKAVAVPNNIHMAGWFVDTVLPGQQGLSIIDGHVSGRKNDAIFKNLAKLKKGDQFTVEFGDGSTKQFAVEDVVTVKVGDSASVLFSQKPGLANQLNLITCGGRFDEKTEQFDERVIAITKAL